MSSRPADEAVDHEALAVRRGDGAARRAEVDPDVEDLSHSVQFPFCCGDSFAPAYARIPSNSACGDLLPVLRLAQHRRLFLVRDAADLGQDGRHVGGHEHDERRALDAPVLEAGVDVAQGGEELMLDGRGQLVRFVAPRVGVDAVEQLAHVGERVAGDAVLARRQRRQRRIVRRRRGSRSRCRGCSVCLSSEFTWMETKMSLLESLARRARSRRAIVAVGRRA